MKQILLILLLFSNTFADYATYLLHIECNEKAKILTITPTVFHLDESHVNKEDRILHKKLDYYIGSSVCPLSPQINIDINSNYINLGYAIMNTFSIKLSDKNTHKDLKINSNEQVLVTLVNNNIVIKKRTTIPKASFSCKNAITNTEKYICSNHSIASQDYRMQKLYNYLQSVYGEQAQAELKNEQKKWLLIRNKQPIDFIDLYLIYSSRLFKLWNLFEKNQETYQE